MHECFSTDGLTVKQLLLSFNTLVFHSCENRPSFDRLQLDLSNISTFVIVHHYQFSIHKKNENYQIFIQFFIETFGQISDILSKNKFLGH
jgi:hypothetical protein